MRHGILLILIGILTGCFAQQPSNPPKTVEQVDLTRYQGTWYEIARLPMKYQKDCLASEAEYRLKDDGEVAVTNRCTTAQGELKAAQGTAWPQESGQTSRLWVRFHNWFSDLLPWLTRGHYWVLYLDQDYRLSLVGTPDRQFLWLLARTPEISDAERAQLLKVATEQGYALDALIWRSSAHAR